MRILKSHPLISLVKGYLVDSPQPSNISYLLNFGSLLGFCLVIQIITGVTLAMHYNPSVLEAFNSVEHVMRDVNNGWLINYLHSNIAYAFFFIVYLYVDRQLYCLVFQIVLFAISLIGAGLDTMGLIGAGLDTIGLIGAVVHAAGLIAMLIGVVFGAFILELVINHGCESLFFYGTQFLATEQQHINIVNHLNTVNKPFLFININHFHRITLCDAILAGSELYNTLSLGHHLTVWFMGKVVYILGTCLINIDLLNLNTLNARLTKKIIWYMDNKAALNTTTFKHQILNVINNWKMLVFLVIPVIMTVKFLIFIMPALPDTCYIIRMYLLVIAVSVIGLGIIWGIINKSLAYRWAIVRITLVLVGLPLTFGLALYLNMDWVCLLTNNWLDTLLLLVNPFTMLCDDWNGSLLTTPTPDGQGSSSGASNNNPGSGGNGSSGGPSNNSNADFALKYKKSTEDTWKRMAKDAVSHREHADAVGALVQNYNDPEVNAQSLQDISLTRRKADVAERLSIRANKLLARHPNGTALEPDYYQMEEKARFIVIHRRVYHGHLYYRDMTRQEANFILLHVYAFNPKVFERLTLNSVYDGTNPQAVKWYAYSKLVDLADCFRSYD